MILLSPLLFLPRIQATKVPQKRNTDDSCKLKNFIPDVTPVNSTHISVSWEELFTDWSGRNILAVRVLELVINQTLYLKRKVFVLSGTLVYTMVSRFELLFWKEDSSLLRTLTAMSTTLSNLRQ